MNQRGMSLIEVMVTVAILGIVALGSMNLFETQVIQQNEIQYRSELTVITDEIRNHLGNSDACRQTLGSVNLGPPPSTTSAGPSGLIDPPPGPTSPVTDIKNGSGTVKWDTNTLYNNKTIRIAKMSFEYVPGDDVASPGKGQGRLVLELLSPKKTSAVKERRRLINITVRRNIATGVMASCSANTVGDVLWRRTPSVPENIYYMDGAVGVGTNQPMMPFDMAGGVRIGTSSADCDADRAGALRYNTYLKLHEFCDGLGAWLPVTPETIFAMSCAWSGDMLGIGGFFKSCVPRSCPAVVSRQIGTEMGEVTSVVVGRATGNTKRLCSARTTILMTFCHWEKNGGLGGGYIGSCDPPACPVDFRPLDVINEATGGSAGLTVGNSKRVCVRKPMTF